MAYRLQDNPTKSEDSLPPSKEMELISSISQRLVTGLNDDALAAIADLLRAGVHPDAVVAAVSSLQQQTPGRR